MKQEIKVGEIKVTSELIDETTEWPPEFALGLNSPTDAMLIFTGKKTRRKFGVELCPHTSLGVVTNLMRILKENLSNPSHRLLAEILEAIAIDLHERIPKCAEERKVSGKDMVN